MRNKKAMCFGAATVFAGGPRNFFLAPPYAEHVESDI
jgi:hypothetical protein